MTTLGLYFRMSREEANGLRRRLNALAAEMGYTASSGPTKGQGNLAALLVGIDKQEVTLRKEEIMNEWSIYPLKRTEKQSEADPCNCTRCRGECGPECRAFIAQWHNNPDTGCKHTNVWGVHGCPICKD